MNKEIFKDARETEQSDNFPFLEKENK